MRLKDVLKEISEVSEMNMTGDTPTELLGLLLYIRALARDYEPSKYGKALVRQRRARRERMKT